MRVRRGLLAGAMAIGLALVACREEPIHIREPDKSADYNSGALAAAIDAFVAAGRTPAAYRQLALAIDGLRSGFDESTADRAELDLILLARAPLTSFVGQPSEAQVDGLALTVWPTVLEVTPLPDEVPPAYVARVCGGALASECKHIVPEHQAPVLAGVVAQRFADRARDAVAGCLLCAGDRAYADTVKAFVDVTGAATARALRDEAAGAPLRWPTAGDRAVPWIPAPLFTLDGDGLATLDGSPVDGGQWRVAMKALRASNSAATLGVFVGPADRVDTLRAIVADAAAAGFATVELAVRAPAYPYELRAYPIAARRDRGRASVSVRDIDSIQVLVQALDNHATDAPARI